LVRLFDHLVGAVASGGMTEPPSGKRATDATAPSMLAAFSMQLGALGHKWT
jgi:hypothetical protein